MPEDSTRITYVSSSAHLKSRSLTNSKVVITEYIYWGMVECSTAIFAACLPTIQVFLMKETFAPVIRLKSSRSFRSLRSMFRGRSSRRGSDSDDGGRLAAKTVVVQGDARGPAIPLPTLAREHSNDFRTGQGFHYLGVHRSQIANAHTEHA